MDLSVIEPPGYFGERSRQPARKIGVGSIDCLALGVPTETPACFGGTAQGGDGGSL